MAKRQQQLTTLRQKESPALRLQLVAQQTALQKARVELAFGRLPNVATIRHLKAEIARIQTHLSEKEAARA